KYIIENWDLSKGCSEKPEVAKKSCSEKPEVAKKSTQENRISNKISLFNNIAAVNYNTIPNQ
ncbi:hypothetical protein COBT_003287, partial [Conglomerata obtusa]